MDANTVIKNVVDMSIWEDAIWVNKEEAIYFVPIWRCGNSTFMHLAEDHDFELFKGYNTTNHIGFTFIRHPLKRIIGQLWRAYENQNLDANHVLVELSKGNILDIHMQTQSSFLKKYNCNYYLDLDQISYTNNTFIDELIFEYYYTGHVLATTNEFRKTIEDNNILNADNLAIIHEVYREDFELYENKIMQSM